MEQQQEQEQQQDQQEEEEQEQEQRKEEEGSGLYKPCLQDGELVHAFDSSVQSVDPMSIDQCQTMRDMDDSQLVGAPSGADVAASASAIEDVPMVEVIPAAAAAMVVTLEETSAGKRKRGRPPKALGNTTKQSKTTTPSQSQQLQSQRKKKDEEDVCFICFDGGSLVLCDRRGCPKAYHPSCIKRDEAFFKSRAKWNCGWHICSSCQKAAHYMCYTCTTSLCKGCIKDADYQCVRGNMGFCGTCMRTVMLIENLQGNKEMAEVDFDDKSSWEYLFKMYWIFLKRKIHLTSDELIQAKNPWKEADSMASKKESSFELFDCNDNKGSSVNNHCVFKETNNSKRRKMKMQPILNNDSLSMEKSGNTYLSDKGTPLPEGTRWASKELLEFVAHMKNGDASVLSQYDVQALLLEYIKKNDLRDPRKKCQIVCDSRLINLFGKARVGHFEMLKLLESHFLNAADDIFKVGVVDADASQVEVDDINFDNQLLMGSDKKRKTRKKADERARQTNLDAFAAIDVHNINLIYLRRNLMENLMDDAHNFHDKVVGSIVRIRISSNDQKQDVYRLVQVVGTSKVAESYKIGERTTDVMLEILNLNKKEAIPIDEISNQDFSEDECKRLRQSIKCGLIKRFTVGEIQAIAITLQAVRVNDGLETEILRLNHLRDRASEKGHRKELREFVEKLQLLNSPEERQRRLHEIPEVRTDPNMDPSYESEDNAGELDEKKQDDNVRSKNSGDGRKGRESISTRRGGKSCEQSRNLGKISNAHKDGTTQLHERLSQCSWNQEREVPGIIGWSTPAVNSSGSVAIGWNNQAVVAPEISQLALSTGIEQSANDFEIEKLWHYQDPSRIIRGPFSMIQLRRWSGHFPSDLRIWRISENQDDSVLLTDALSGQCQEKPLLLDNGNLLSPKVGVASDDRHNFQDGGWSGCMNAADSKEVEGSWNPKQDDSSVHCNGNDELAKSNGWGSNSSSWTTPVDVVNSNEGQNGDVVQGCDSLKGNNSWPDQKSQVCSSSLPPPPFSGKSYETLPHQVKEGHGVESNSDQDNGNCNSPMTAEGQIKKEQGQIKTEQGQIKKEQGYENRSDSEGHSGQSSGQSWRPPPINSSSNGLDSKSGFISVVKSLETTEQKQEIDFPDLPSPTPKQSNGDSKGHAAENKQAASSNVPVHDAGPSWSTASSLVGGTAQLTEAAGKWGGYSPTSAKPSIEEWDSNLVSASSLKPTEMVSDHAATPTSINGQLTHSSPSHPASNASNWPAIDTEPTEFCSLVDESVSDLLAEVEAMESLGGLASPTSKMNCGEDAFTEDSKNDCLSPVAGFSPALDPGKGDALSSTGDLQVASQSTVTDGPHGVWQADVLDPQKRSSGHSSTSIEVEGEAKLSEVSVNQWEASDIPPTVPSTANVEMAATDTAWRVGSESTDTSWGAVQGNANLGWGGLDQRNTNVGLGTGQVITQESSSMNLGTSAVTPDIWGPQPRYGGEGPQLRYGGERWFNPRDRGFQGRDTGFGRGRSTWNRQSSFGGGNGGGSYRPPPKGQRVCKFYENGYCKKGASCGFLHP